MAVPTQSPQAINQYNQQRSALNQNLLKSKAQSQYQRQLSDLGYMDALQDYNMNWGRKRQQLPTGFVQRGVMDSGMYHQALQNYAQDRLRGLNNLSTQNLMGNLTYTLGDRQAEDSWASGMMRSHSNQYADKAALAAALREIF